MTAVSSDIVRTCQELKPTAMNNDDQDRNARISRLQELAHGERGDLPQLDREAFDTALARLEEQERHASRMKWVGWKAIAVVVLVAVVLFAFGMR